MSETPAKYEVATRADAVPATVFRREPPDVYHASGALSATGFKRFLVSPLHFQHYRATGGGDSPALAFGRLFHTLALEPDTFAERYAIAPECDKRTKSGKAEYAAFLESIADREAVTDDGVHRAEKMAVAVRGIIPLAGRVEATVRVTSQYGALQCRPDKIGDDGVIWDLKSTRSAAGFDRAMYGYGYHWQDAFYRHVMMLATGTLPPPIRFVAVESTEPHDVIVRTVEETLYGYMRPQLEAKLQQYAECVASGSWPGIDGDGGVKAVPVPVWVERELDDTETGGDVASVLDSMFGPEGE